MNKIFMMFFVLFVANNAKAQLYGEYDLGMAYRPGMGNTPLMNLHIGYQLNEVIDPNAVIVGEYDQRTLTGGISPFYLGGRIGFGWNTGENTTITLLGGGYYRLLSSSEKATGNYWIGGYGLNFNWKCLSIEASKVEFYQASIGCHYFLD